MRLRRALAIALGLALMISTPTLSAEPRGVASVITEFKRGKGVVEVREAGAADWRSAAPLLALRAGDTVRVTEDASALVLLGGGRGSVKVDAATSPFVVPALPAAESAVSRGAALLRKALQSLSANRPDPEYLKMGTRGGRRSTVILSPRNGPILPGGLQIEWAGIRERRYRLYWDAYRARCKYRQGTYGEGCVLHYPHGGTC